MFSERNIYYCALAATIIFFSALTVNFVRFDREREARRALLSFPHELTHAVQISVDVYASRQSTQGGLDVLTAQTDPVTANDQPQIFTWLASSSHYRRTAPSLPPDCVLLVLSSTDRIEDQHLYFYISATGELGENRQNGLWCTVSPQFP